jgi:hypothetical protein
MYLLRVANLLIFRLRRKIVVFYVALSCCTCAFNRIDVSVEFCEAYFIQG